MNILFFLKPKGDLIYFKANDTLKTALETMSTNKYSTYPVVNHNGSYNSTITEGDILRFLYNNKFQDMDKLLKTKVKNIDKTFVFNVININVEMEDLISNAKNQNYIPVKDDQNNFIGIILRSELINYLCEKKDDA